jgi:hypothetical protein
MLALHDPGTMTKTQSVIMPGFVAAFLAASPDSKQSVVVSASKEIWMQQEKERQFLHWLQWGWPWALEAANVNSMLDNLFVTFSGAWWVLISFIVANSAALLDGQSEAGWREWSLSSHLESGTSFEIASKVAKGGRSLPKQSAWCHCWGQSRSNSQEGDGASFGELRMWKGHRVQSQIEAVSAEARRTCPASLTATMETENNGDIWSWPSESFGVAILVLKSRSGSNQVLSRLRPTSCVWLSGKMEWEAATLSKRRTALLTIAARLISRVKMVATFRVWTWSPSWKQICSLLTNAMTAKLASSAFLLTFVFALFKNFRLLTRAAALWLCLQRHWRGWTFAGCWCGKSVMAQNKSLLSLAGQTTVVRDSPATALLSLI